MWPHRIEVAPPAFDQDFRLPEAVEDFTRGLSLSPENAQMLANRGRVYRLLEHHQLALQDFTNALILDPKYASDYCLHRALGELARYQSNAALADLTIALLLDPENAAVTLSTLQKAAAVVGRELRLELV